MTLPSPFIIKSNADECSADYGDPASMRGHRAGRFDVSIVVPIYNEEESIPHLIGRLFDVIERSERSFEVLAVNDGSRDRSLELLRREAEGRAVLRVIDLRRNFGQTAAMMAGFDHAAGNVIVTIDADLQNDPEDIALLLAQIDAGADVASGWRQNRQDAKIRRNFVSRVANRIISRISGVRLNDYGCTLKAYRRDVMQGVRLYGEMHRFIPIYASWMGARIVEVPVRHHARKFGSSKYGLERIFKVILDLMVVKFFDRHLVKPIYIFGGFGLGSVCLALLTIAAAIGLKFGAGIAMVQTPLPLLAAMLFLIGCMSVLMGLIAEIMVRTYFESQGRRPYLVRHIYNAWNGS